MRKKTAIAMVLEKERKSEGEEESEKKYVEGKK